MNESQRKLLEKVVEAGPKPWALHKIPEPKLIDDLPKILYWMYGHDENPEFRVSDYFTKGRLNKPGNLITFTQRPIEAANYFNLGLKGEGDRRLVVMLFPYETTKLKRWVEDPGAHHNLPGTRIFLTDQRVRREDTLLVEYKKLIYADPINPKNDRNIQVDQYSTPNPRGGGMNPPVLPPEKQTREHIMKEFSITSQYQEEMLQLFK